MQDSYLKTENSDGNPLFKQENNFPINLNWRRKYYWKVLLLRLTAFILDFFIIFMWLYALIFSIFFNDYDSETTFLPRTIGFLLTLFIAYGIVCGLFEASKWQGTPGKRIMKLQVSGIDGNRLSFIRAFLRNFYKGITIVFWVFTLPFLIYNGIVAKHFWHDRLSKTDIGKRL